MAARILTFLLLLSALAVRGADTMPALLSDRVRSLRIADGDNDTSVPVIWGDGVLVISFDLLSEEREYLRYSIEHCDARWQPSGIPESDYLDGFNEAAVPDGEYSRATTVHYVHYTIVLPNEDMSPLISGNYILTVYPETEPDSPLLRCRFRVSEQTAPVRVDWSPRTDVDYLRAHQQLTIDVNVEDAQVEDIFNDLTVIIEQNGRGDNSRSAGHPMRVSGHTATFEHSPALIFPGGNEYRRFETVTENYPGLGIEEIRVIPPYRHFAVATDGPRDEYFYDYPLNGRYVVRAQNSSESDTEADYGIVHFALQMPYIPNAEVYLDADFTLRLFDDGSRMRYNSETGTYEKAVLLKQGSYSYQYLVVRRDASCGSTAEAEGDFHQTANRYNVYVYHRRRGERYDRLIGVGTVSAIP